MCWHRLIQSGQLNKAEPEWWDRHSQRFSEYHFPSGKEKQLALAETIGRDGYYLLTQIFAEEAPPSPYCSSRKHPAPGVDPAVLP